MQEAFLSLAWIIASILFVSSLRGLSHPETARRGNGYGIVGMLLAVCATLMASDRVGNLPVLIGAIAAGATIGAVLAQRVAMTSMPELVAILHSFVGLAAVLVGYGAYLDAEPGQAGRALMLAEVWLDVLIGAITFTGSIIAFFKLRGTLSGRPLLLPARHILNVLIALTLLGLAIPFLTADATTV